MRKITNASAGKKKVPTVVAVLIAVVCMIGTFILLGCLFTGTSSTTQNNKSYVSSYKIMDMFDIYMINTVSDALDGVLSVEKVFSLSDNVLVAPNPDPSRFGESSDPTTLQWLLDDAAKLLDGQQTLFTTETVILPDSTINYYLDETIFAVTWKQVFDNIVYTISEVKISHPSQFRRFLADGEYGSERQYLTTEMAASVNAVVASAGDFYKYRQDGVIVYNREVKRLHRDQVDTCFIDENGDMIFVNHGQFPDKESAQAYVDQNGIRFSLSFGPILVDNGQRCEPKDYELGEVNERYPRAALCQMGQLHYLMVVVNLEGKYYSLPDIHTFAQRLSQLGCEKAYTLDGGQTATIAMNGQLINHVNYGSQRQISDIIYFATALKTQ